MGLFDLFSSSSSSSSSSTTNNFDKRIAADNGAFGLSGDSNAIHIQNTSTDAGSFVLADSALSSANNSLSVVSGVAAGNTALAGDVAHQGLVLSAYTSGLTTDLAKSTSQDASALALQAIDVTNSALSNTLNGLIDGNQNALSAVSTASKDALAYSSQNTSATLAEISRVNSSALAFADSLSFNAMDLSNRSQAMMAGSFSEALGFTTNIVDKAFQSGDLAQQASSQAVNMVAQAYDTATNYQAEKATTDSRYLVIAGIVAVALMALRMGFK